jgi:hypothetical protein
MRITTFDIADNLNAFIFSAAAISNPAPTPGFGRGIASFSPRSSAGCGQDCATGSRRRRTGRTATMISSQNGPFCLQKDHPD